jgi:EAL domain-containing protein (putative c-di-GMP-specific phosphodiesterase class I)
MTSMQIDMKPCQPEGSAPEDPSSLNPASLDPVASGSVAPDDLRSDRCVRCAIFPDRAATSMSATERLLVYAPAPPALGKVRRAAVESGYAVDRIEEAVVILIGPTGDWTTFLNALEARLSTLEAGETRVVPIGGAGVDTFGVAMAALKARTVPTLLAELRDGWLQQAVAAGTLTSYFQPIVDVVTGEIYAHEALMRAVLDDGRVANGGQIVDAGRRVGALHVLDQVGRTSAIHCAHRLGMQTNLFINFFPTVVYDPVHCLQTTRQAMRETGMTPEHIVFEVVESEQIADRNHLLEILAYYRREGFRVALDDLGSGYSSLNLLAALRPDFVKLDMELAREVANDSLRRALVQALVGTAHAYGIEVIAEGVETVESARVLASMGIRLLQGYLFGKPAPGLGRLDREVLSAIL